MPYIGQPIVPYIQSMPNDGDYNSSKAIRSGAGWGSQHLILSRVNDASWSFPSFQNKQYLIIELLNNDSSKEHHRKIKN